MERSPRLGYALTATGAALFALGGVMARKLLDDGVSPLHLVELRSVLTLVLLAAFLAVTDRERLRIRRADVPALALLGIGGLAAVQTTYFAAIERLDIGVALTIQYLAPLLILAAQPRHASRAMWGAGALSVLGAFLVARAYDADGLDGAGLLWAVAACVTFAVNLTASEHAGDRGIDARTTLLWGFAFCTLALLVLRPPWTFPFGAFDDLENALLGLGVGVLGTLVPFALLFTGIRHIGSARAAVVATLEPVIASILAWPLLDQVLSAPQVVGVVVVCAAVAWVQASSLPTTWPTSAP